MNALNICCLIIAVWLCILPHQSHALGTEQHSSTEQPEHAQFGVRHPRSAEDQWQQLMHTQAGLSQRRLMAKVDASLHSKVGQPFLVPDIERKLGWVQRGELSECQPLIFKFADEHAMCGGM